jgi:hypothetical protein
MGSVRKRHAKPTAMQLSERTYRKMLSLQREVADLRKLQLRSYEAHLPLIDHCARLLREKETLQRMLAIEIGKSYTVTGEKVIDETDWDDLFERRSQNLCHFVENHKPNITCSHCGFLEMIYQGEI